MFNILHKSKSPVSTGNFQGESTDLSKYFLVDNFWKGFFSILIDAHILMKEPTLINLTPLILMFENAM